MPIVPFDVRRRLIVVQATALAIDGRPATLTVLVDTGAGQTGFRRSILRGLGIDVDRVTEFVQVNTASETVQVPRVTLPMLNAFGVTFTNLPVLCLPLPATVPADGVLGFDVLSRFRLFVNYRRGLLVAEPFNGFWQGVRFLWHTLRTL